MMLERPSPGRSTRAESLRRLRDARYRQRLKAGPVVVPVTIGPSSSTGWFGFIGSPRPRLTRATPG